MKKQIPNGFTPFTDLELTALTLEVKETLAKDYSVIHDRISNSVDLWRKWESQEEDF